MKWVATKFPITKKVPRWVPRLVHKPLGLLFRTQLWVQRTFGVGAPPPPHHD
jgi:hypothetical protein